MAKKICTFARPKETPMRLPIKPPFPPATISATALALVVSIIVSIAGHFSPSPSQAIPPDVVVTGADTSAWLMGREHAAALAAECATDDERGLRLLDVRARETNIRARIGNSAADAYVSGFEHGLRAASDSLASVILD